MAIIYIDKNDNYKCHASNEGGEFIAYETEFFDGKIDKLIEGYICVPFGESMIMENGLEVVGEAIFPWQDCNMIWMEQYMYENEQLKAQNTEYESVLIEIEQALGIEAN